MTSAGLIARSRSTCWSAWQKRTASSQRRPSSVEAWSAGSSGGKLHRLIQDPMRLNKGGFGGANPDCSFGAWAPNPPLTKTDIF